MKCLQTPADDAMMRSSTNPWTCKVPKYDEYRKKMQAISLTRMSAAGCRAAFDPNHLAPAMMKIVGGTPSLFSAGQRLEKERHDPLRFRIAARTELSGEESSKAIRVFESVEVHDAETPSKVAQISETFSSYDHRLQVLEEQGRLDGYSLNEASRKAFSGFCWRYPWMRRARLVLMENGNLRATWKDDDGAHVGLQFQDSQSIQFVIFGRRRLDSPVPRVSGRDSVDGIMRQIDALDVRRAVTHGP